MVNSKLHVPGGYFNIFNKCQIGQANQYNHNQFSFYTYFGAEIGPIPNAKKYLLFAMAYQKILNLTIVKNHSFLGFSDAKLVPF